MARPDLSNPLAPDIEEAIIASQRRTTHVSQGGTSLRSSEHAQGDGEFEWPESGPSGLPIEEKEKVKNLGPFGAKALASMTGAVAVSLLSRSLTNQCATSTKILGGDGC